MFCHVDSQNPNEYYDVGFFFPFPQNLEDDVTIDTIPNVKKKHEVNVGM
jgi:hypothetical protein